MNFRILRFKKVGSTNDLALKLARAGAPEGTVITAEYQTHGRGRGKRRWYSAPGKNLLFSLILRPALKASEAPWLTRLASEAVAESLRELYRIPAVVKKPNDVLVSGKKISGVLVESATSNHKVEYAVVGIGLNVWASPSLGVPNCTSIIEQIQRKTSKTCLFNRILNKFYSKYLKMTINSNP